jgi:hypothetical protein
MHKGRNKYCSIEEVRNYQRKREGQNTRKTMIRNGARIVGCCVEQMLIWIKGFYDQKYEIRPSKISIFVGHIRPS